MSESNGEYTPTQKRFLALLSDGLPHTYDELRACLWDELGRNVNIRNHIKLLRPKLRRKGQDIVCVLTGYQRRYQQVRLLRPNTE